jgi:hypothetical protein
MHSIFQLTDESAWIDWGIAETAQASKARVKFDEAEITCK